MGYCIELISNQFFMKKENFGKALIAFKKCFTEENMTCSDSTGKHFRWVSTKAALNSSTIDEALEAIRYIPIKDENENIQKLKFTGQNCGDEEIFFDALAPYIETGSYLSFRGEDGNKWTWKFINGKLDEEVY